MLFLTEIDAWENRDLLPSGLRLFLSHKKYFTPDNPELIVTSGPLGPARIVPIAQLEDAMLETAQAFSVSTEFIGIGGTFGGISHESESGRFGAGFAG